MPGAEGFDPDHLTGFSVALPQPATDPVRADIRPTTAGEPVRHCTHFSLALSASRRMCRWVAWNLDGGSHLTTGQDQRRFAVDPAYAGDHQVGAELYRGNDLDQGHVAAFSDVSWGASDIAALARKESCYFSNITPQLDSFNRSSLKGVWGELESEIAKENAAPRQRLSEFGGPIFGDHDLEYHGVLVPREFWKIVVYIDDDRSLRAKGFRLTQRDLDTELGLLPLDEFRIYQQPVSELAAETGLDFGVVAQADTAPAPAEGLVAGPTVRRVHTLADVSAPGW
jgi:endonuclease G